MHLIDMAAVAALGDFSVQRTPPAPSCSNCGDAPPAFHEFMAVPNSLAWKCSSHDGTLNRRQSSRASTAEKWAFCPSLNMMVVIFENKVATSTRSGRYRHSAEPSAVIKSTRSFLPWLNHFLCPSFQMTSVGRQSCNVQRTQPISVQTCNTEDARRSRRKQRTSPVTTANNNASTAERRNVESKAYTCPVDFETFAGWKVSICT